MVAVEVEHWVLRATCRGSANLINFYPDYNDYKGIAAAKAVCAICPVRVECGDHALATHEPYGVWGGMSESERRRLLGVKPLKRRGRSIPD
jgi:WhiB family redox-sensing transcriptional regulator